MIRFSKTLGPQQRHEQVGREPGESEPEQDEVQRHGSAPLTGHEVESQQGEARNAEGQHQQVQHMGLTCTALSGNWTTGRGFAATAIRAPFECCGIGINAA